MSKAIKCDRCGRCFVMDELTEIDRVAKINRMSVLSKESYAEGKFVQAIDSIDLCDDCTMAFLNLFMKNFRVEGEKGSDSKGWMPWGTDLRKENKAENEEDGV